MIIIEFKKVNKRRRETKKTAIAKAFTLLEKTEYASVLMEREIEHVRLLAIMFDS